MKYYFGENENESAFYLLVMEDKKYSKNLLS